MGFILDFYIIFGTNLLTGGPARIVVFCLFLYSEEKEYQTESKRNKTFAMIFIEPEDVGERSMQFQKNSYDHARSI